MLQFDSKCNSESDHMHCSKRVTNTHDSPFRVTPLLGSLSNSPRVLAIAAATVIGHAHHGSVPSMPTGSGYSNERPCEGVQRRRRAGRAQHS